MNETSQEEYFGIGQVAETLGLFLYLIDPAKSSFETIEECPDYVSQVSRYFTSFVTLGDFVISTVGHPFYYVDNCCGGCYQSFSEEQNPELG